jgi:AraC-like DNA-binding protein
MDDKRLYDRAAKASRPPSPLWHVDGECALFAGPLGYNAPHHHSVPVYLVGLQEPFRLRLGGGRWLSCRAAVIPAGTTYELDVRGEPIAVLYVEPTAGGANLLVPLLRDAREVDGAVVGGAGEVAPLRSLYESNGGAREASAVLDDLLRFCEPRSRRTLDARIARGVLHLQSCYDDRLPVAEVARHVGLSASRFQHLFAEEVGVPFRRYRSWHRLRAAIREVAKGESFTAAAHAAGFSDQAHFSNEFRRTFGAPPSASLRLARA